MGIPDHLTCLLRNLYASQEATVRTRHGTMDSFKIGKGVHQGCVLSSCLFNLYTEYIMWNAGLDEAYAGIKTVRRNINNLRYTDDTILIAEREEELKSLLMKVEDKSEKADLKLKIQKTKNTAFCPITSWQKNRETMETVTNFIFLVCKITADGDHSHEINRCSFLGRKATINLDSILKRRNNILPTKLYSESYGFSSSHCMDLRVGSKKGWTTKKDWCFLTVVLDKTLESPLDWKEIKPVNPKGNQPWIFIGRTDA